MHAALAAAATMIAAAFALATAERWVDRRRPHELAWTLALLLFAAASAALWMGAALGWEPATFRAFYALGAILNVPVLALGTVYLLGGRRLGHACAAAVGVLGAFACGFVAAAPLGPLDDRVLPRGSEVFGVAPRVMAAVGSGLGALVLFAGALVSAVRLVRRTATRRLAVANGLIALGTLILSAGGLLNSTFNEMDAFSVSLVAGITAIFAGFLITEGPAADRG